MINLKFIGKGTYFNIREQYIFPVVRTTWQQQQQEIFSELKDREGGAVLAGDGRCDSPGHSAKYCTYTFLDVRSQKVIDFNVVSVSQVANSNQTEKKGFVNTLANIEANDIEVKLISTDRHTQIKKEMRVNHANIDHQFDPWLRQSVRSYLQHLKSLIAQTLHRGFLPLSTICGGARRAAIKIQRYCERSGYQ